jgi:6-phosphofructokinase
MRIGVLTAGGDAPGLNAAIRAIGQMATRDGHEVIGIANGWAGLADEYAGRRLEISDFGGILGQGGTLLGTARYNLDDPAGGRERVLTAMDAHLDALVAIGGESLDRLYTTAASHHRVMVVETMGRATGWVAAMGGLAGGADLIVIPEFPLTMDQILDHLVTRRSKGYGFSIVVVAEGINLESLGGTEVNGVSTEGIGGVRLATRGVGQFVAAQIDAHGGFEVRTTVLGHLQRGGSPSAYDRIWATRVGAAAYEAVAAGTFGVIPVVQGNEVILAPLSTVAHGQRQVPREIYELCSAFF